MLKVGHFGKNRNASPICFVQEKVKFFLDLLSLRPIGFVITFRLAAVLDSLVRVSRRVVLRHFAHVLKNLMEEGALTSVS
jgi:hypothetical protein